MMCPEAHCGKREFGGAEGTHPPETMNVRFSIFMMMELFATNFSLVGVDATETDLQRELNESPHGVVEVLKIHFRHADSRSHLTCFPRNES